MFPSMSFWRKRKNVIETLPPITIADFEDGCEVITASSIDGGAVNGGNDINKTMGNFIDPTQSSTHHLLHTDKRGSDKGGTEKGYTYTMVGINNPDRSFSTTMIAPNAMNICTNNANTEMIEKDSNTEMHDVFNDKNKWSTEQRGYSRIGLDGIEYLPPNSPCSVICLDANIREIIRKFIYSSID
jgi:hypothetical protein